MIEGVKLKTQAIIMCPLLKIILLHGKIIKKETV